MARVRRQHIFFIPLLTLGFLSCTSPDARIATKEPSAYLPDGRRRQLEDDLLSPSPWVDSVMQSMTLEEKVGQLIMVRALGHYVSTDNDQYERLQRLVEEEKVGGLIMFQGDVYEIALLLNRLQQRAKIPLMVSSDLERGLAMRVRRATYFPDAMAIGATRNPEYAYKVGRATAEEAHAIGIHQNYAPVADINSNPANPVINTRAFGDNPGLVAEMAEAYARGTNDGGAIATVKHFPGHGDTGVDSHLDLPVLPFDMGRLDSVELPSFKRAIDSGVKSIMVAHLEVPAIDSTPGRPATLSAAAMTSLLREKLGFRGLIVTDAMTMKGMSKGFSIGESAVEACNAGADMLLMPADEQAAMHALLNAVRSHVISEARINESVRRILGAKHWLRLDVQRMADVGAIARNVANREHRTLAKDIARDAITILRNDGNVLPLRLHPGKKVFIPILADNEDEMTAVNRPGNAWTVEPVGSHFVNQFRRRHDNVETYRLTPGSNELNFDAALSRIRNSDIVVMPAFVKVRTSSGRIGMPSTIASFLRKAGTLGKPAIFVSCGNPYVVDAYPGASAVVCAYADAEVLVEACVEALFGEIDVHGKLPVSVPGAYNYGSGMEFVQTCLRVEDPVSAGFDPMKLRRVDSLIAAAIRDSAFPAAQLAIVKDEKLIENRAFGTYAYEMQSRPINNLTMFDLASLTKVIATTAAVMKLYDRQMLGLDDPVSAYIPEFSTGEKASIVVRQLLLHTSGMQPFLKLYDVCKTPEEALDSIYAAPLLAHPGDTTIYSDLGLITLGKVVERISGMPLDVFVRKEFYEPLHMNSTMFNPPQSLVSTIAPTEVDTVWRKSLVRGTVHDERAALLGGVAGHAGLFSNASDLSVFMQMLMNKGTYGGVRYLSEKTVREFTERKDLETHRGLGWDFKSATGSSAGKFFSMSSFGHTGFTGTSIWADPGRNLVVIFLTNRVYPTRANSRIARVRPALHDAIVNALRGEAPMQDEHGNAGTKVRYN